MLKFTYHYSVFELAMFRCYYLLGVVVAVVVAVVAAVAAVVAVAADAAVVVPVAVVVSLDKLVAGFWFVHTEMCWTKLLSKYEPNC